MPPEEKQKNSFLISLLGVLRSPSAEVGEPERPNVTENIFFLVVFRRLASTLAAAPYRCLPGSHVEASFHSPFDQDRKDGGH